MRTIVALVFASACFAQQPEFEVASIKPNTSSEIGSNFNRMPGGGLNAINVTLREMVGFAWDLRDHQLIGMSGWMGIDRYDVFAKPTQNDNPTGAKRSFDDDFKSIRLKMRALLIDRFKLAAHMETRELPAYALTVVKGGAHWQPTTSDGLKINDRNGLVICKKISMKDFAERALSYRMGRPVIDKTGITAEFDFEIKFTDESAGPNAEPTGPDFLTAMREQLGLVLQSQKAPVDVLVIERAEKATAN
ncbi:MAG: TIGR03435 family protein [Candidatus Solibacter sp.]